MDLFLGGMFMSGYNRYQKLKFLFLTISFAFVIGSYTIAKELKDSIFVNIVGQEYLPTAKLLVIFLLIPAALGYSYLVDIFRRYQLVTFYCCFFGIILTIFTILLGHSTIGLYNVNPSSDRLFGWIFYFILEGYSPFVVSVFWAFLNSVSSPEDAKNSYPVIVAGSKIGGILTALLAWYMLSNCTIFNGFSLCNHDVVAHQVLMGIVAGMLLCVPIFLKLLIRYVPGQYLHGYEAVYQLEKKQQWEEKSPKTSMLSGIKLLIESRYILGIFGLVFFYETLNVVLNFQRIGLLKQASTSMANLTASMFWQRFLMHLGGMFISFFGTQWLFNRFRIGYCLMAVPLFISLLLLFFVMTYSADTILYVFIGLGTINYSLSSPLRELLYIPATKDMKFKAKAWIDTFGTKFSKGFGSLFANVVAIVTTNVRFASMMYVGFFSSLMFLWFVASWLLGKKYEKAIKNNEIIGAE